MNCSFLSIFVFVTVTAILTVTDGTVCNTEMCKKYAARLVSSIDRCIDPCDDFSSFVCGNFDKTHKIPDGGSEASTYNDIEEDITLTLKSLLESQPLTDPSRPQTKAAIYYRSCLNKAERNNLSKESILGFVSDIEKEPSYEEKLVKLISTGMSSRFLSFSADQDSKNSDYYILNIGRGELILSEATLKSPNDEEEKKQIEVYKRYMNKVLDLLELWNEDRTILDKIVNLQIKIAKALPSLADQMDPDKYYNKVTIGDLQKRCQLIPWKTIINHLLEGTGTELCTGDSVVISSLDYVDEICKILHTYKNDKELNEVLEKDLTWAAISSVVNYGSDALVLAAEELKKDLFGVVGTEPLWKTCVTDTSGTLVDIVGNMYVKENFDSQRKRDAEEMLSNVKKVFKEVIEEINWMDDKTKEMAKLKLKSIDQKIGYPDKILNETKLMREYEQIEMDVGHYIENLLAFKETEFVKSMKGIGERSPKDKWLMGPQEVNAYYNPPSNEIVFPASIFRFPLYDFTFPVTINYGGIGTFIGHEILHGFDTSGSKYDDKGNIREWWTKETRAKYDEKAMCIINQYGNFSIYGKKLRSDQTIGEDIADNAGIRMAFKSAMIASQEKTTLPGLDFTPEQLFFVNQAMTECSVFTKEFLLEKMKTDEHTIWKFRINGPLSNMPEFSKAFKCNHDKAMNRHKKCLVW